MLWPRGISSKSLGIIRCGWVGAMEDDRLKTYIAFQITRRGVERVASAAVLEPYKPSDGEGSGGEDGAGGEVPRYSITVFEFLDNDQFSNLDSVLVQSGPRVAMYPCEKKVLEGATANDFRKITHLLERRGLEGRPITNKAQFRAGSSSGGDDDFENDLSRLLGESNLLKYKHELEYHHAMGCLGCLIRELRLLEDESEWGLYRLRLGSLAHHVRIDSSAVEALNLLPPEKDQATECGSIYQILNRCKTKMGERLLGRWLRQPLVDKLKLEARLDMVEYLKNDAMARGNLQDNALRMTPDLDLLATRLQRKRAGLMDMYKVYQFAQRLPHYTGALIDEPDSPVAARFLREFDRLREHFGKFCELVECVIDMDRLPELVINPQHDPALAEVDQEMDKVKGEIETIYERAKNGFASELGIELRLDADKAHGYIFRSTKGSDEKKLRNSRERVDILTIQKNGVHFTTAKLKMAAMRYTELGREYSQKQSALVKKATETSLTYLPLIEAAARLVAEVDVLVSFGHVAALAPQGYVRPKLFEQGAGVLRIKGGRHPCLEMQPDVSFIPNDYTLEAEVSSLNLVTGPNMGGKSTYIRALGCIVLMAQVGSFVPCDEAEISIVDAILARVGAGDAAQRGVSTFMAEMIEASTILQTATSSSLVIIDELGRGTSTFDGFGLAWAISEYIADKLRCFCLFATHFHELTELEQKQEGVKNLHVSALTSRGSITMLYEVKPGPCLESYGIHVAKMARFPDVVIEEAKRKAAELEKFDSKGAFTDHDGGAGSSKKARTTSAAASALIEQYKQQPGSLEALRELARNFVEMQMDTMAEPDVLARLAEMVHEAKAQLVEA